MKQYVIEDDNGNYFGGASWESEYKYAARWRSLVTVSLAMGALARDLCPTQMPLRIRSIKVVAK